MSEVDDDLEQQMAEARRAVEEDPTVPEAWETLGTLQILADENEAAVVSFQRLRVLRPDAASFALLGRALMGVERIREAMTVLREALRQDPGSSEVNGALGTCLLLDGRVDEAEPLLERAVDVDPAHEEAAVGLARIRFLQGDPERAAELCSAVLHSDPVEPLSPLLILADALLAMGGLQEALFAYDAALELVEDDPDIRASRAQVHILLGDEATAEADLAAALSADPACVSALIGMGNLRTVQDRHSDAESAYVDALGVDDRWVPAWGALGAVRLAMEDLDGARDASERGLLLGPEDPTCLLVLAQTEELSGKFARSEELALKAIAANPASHAAHLTAARVGMALEREPERVMFHLDEALRLAPDERARDRIDGLRSAYSDAFA